MFFGGNRFREPFLPLGEGEIPGEHPVQTSTASHLPNEKVVFISHIDIRVIQTIGGHFGQGSYFACCVGFHLRFFFLVFRRSVCVFLMRDKERTVVCLPNFIRNLTDC